MQNDFLQISKTESKSHSFSHTSQTPKHNENEPESSGLRSDLPFHATDTKLGPTTLQGGEDLSRRHSVEGLTPAILQAAACDSEEHGKPFVLQGFRSWTSPEPMELLRVRFDEQVRSEKRKSAGTAIESQVTGALKPWREVVSPHKDVASGRCQQAEFAADLWQVHLGEGSDEYRKPVEFFRRTYLTDSLKHLLVGAVQRLSGVGGDPVVQLQTNFGGGKTHSMLAPYHLFSGTKATEFAGIDAILSESDVAGIPKVNRVDV